MKKLKCYIKVHYSFLFLFALSIVFQLSWLFALYFICLILHEACHAFVAKKLGYKIGRINLLFSGAILEAESDEFSFSDEIKISLAGPLFNISLAFLIVAFWWIYPESYNYTMDLCIINFAIFAFNILPFFPLDGGRILLAFLSKKTSRSEALKIVKWITVVFSFLLFIVFIISLFICPAFAIGTASVNLMMGAFATDKSAVYKRCYFSLIKLERVKRNGLETRYLLASKNMDNFSLYKMTDARHFTIFLLVDDNFNIVRRVTESDLYNSLQTEIQKNSNNKNKVSCDSKK